MADAARLSDRLAACERLSKRFCNKADPQKLKTNSAEAFRKGGPGLWAQIVLHQFWPAVPFTRKELANLTSCSKERIRKPDKCCLDIMHANVLLNMMHHSGFDISRAPMFPTARQWGIVNLCQIVTKVYEAMEQPASCRGIRLASGSHRSLPFLVGVMIDTFCTHEDVGAVGELLPVTQPTPCEVKGNRRLMVVIDDCVCRSNRILAEYPLLVDVVGEIKRGEILEEFCNALAYLESWFYARELFHESLTDDENLLGIFV